jgi:hypothetical protein
VPHHHIVLVAVHDQKASTIGGLMDGRVDDLNATHLHAEIVAQELIVIAREIDDARALAALAQQLLHHVIVRLRPVPALLQPPAIDDIADQIDRVGIVKPHEIEQKMRLASA